MFWIFSFSEHALFDHITGINVQDHIYLMAQYTWNSIGLNSVFRHVRYILTIFGSNKDAKQDVHIQEQSESF